MLPREYANKRLFIFPPYLANASALFVRVFSQGGSVAEWLACWTQAQKGPGLNHSRDAVG